MNRSSTSEHPEYSQSIYPMTRQELAVAPIKWTRLKPAPKENLQDQVIPSHKFAAVAQSKNKQTLNKQTLPVGDQTLAAAATKPSRHSIVERLQELGNSKYKGAPLRNPTNEETTENNRADSPTAANLQPQQKPDGMVVDHSTPSTPAAQTDLPEKLQVGKPKYLKHAVRFGGPADNLERQAMEGRQESVARFQKKQLPVEVDNQQLRSLRGVDSRGKVYSSNAGSIGSTSSATTLSNFLGEHHRSIQKMPIIQVSNPRPTTDRQNIQHRPIDAKTIDTAANQRTDTSAIVAEKAYPYWLHAAIQIVLGTIVIIFLMNMTQWLLSSSTPQIIQRNRAPSSFPVQQANSEVPEDAPQFLR